MPLTSLQMAMVDRLLDEALPLDEAGRRRWLDTLSPEYQDMAYQVADVYAWRGENGKAFAWLQRAYQQRDSGLNGIAYDPLLAGLQSDPRYAALLKSLGLSE